PRCRELKPGTVLLSPRGLFSFLSNPSLRPPSCSFSRRRRRRRPHPPAAGADLIFPTVWRAAATLVVVVPVVWRPDDAPTPSQVASPRRPRRPQTWPQDHHRERAVSSSSCCRLLASHPSRSPSRPTAATNSAVGPQHRIKKTMSSSFRLKVMVLCRSTLSYLNETVCIPGTFAKEGQMQGLDFARSSFCGIVLMVARSSIVIT
ncbi:unnamed protein product, partial [Urochloa humidicola]